jgi:hypothetical protein
MGVIIASLSINRLRDQPPAIPQSWGKLKNLGDTPSSPGRRNLSCTSFFNPLFIKMILVATDEGVQRVFPLPGY